MSTNTGYCYSNTCTALRDAITDLDVRIRVSEQNQKLRDSYSEKLQTLEENISLCKEVLEHVKPLLNDVQDYIANRKKESMQNINNALRMSSEIIPDSAEGVYFQMDGDEAWLSTADGLIVDAVEGGGYRQTSSTFIRSVILNSNPEVLHTLILDEVFALVSPENSAILSVYLDLLCKTTQIISIEQKPQVYSNVDSIMYHFIKGDQYSEVRKEHINRSVERNGA